MNQLQTLWKEDACAHPISNNFREAKRQIAPKPPLPHLLFLFCLDTLLTWVTVKYSPITFGMQVEYSSKIFLSSNCSSLVRFSGCVRCTYFQKDFFSPFFKTLQKGICFCYFFYTQENSHFLKRQGRLSILSSWKVLHI